MKLPFEEWVENEHISENAKGLFISGIICYKNAIYPAALMMTYQGFLVTMKDLIMQGQKPDKYPKQKWEKKIKDLQNEDEWEGAVLEALLYKGEGQPEDERRKDPIFNINSNLRDQIRYWKDRRNDCAHNKDNEISNAYVEMFWSFLKSNFYKLTIEGGMLSLLNKFKLHHDTTYTPYGEDDTYLLKQIKSSVEIGDLNVFWGKALDIVSDIFNWNEEINFIKRVLDINDPILSDSIVKFVKDNENLLKQYLDEYPSDLLLFYSGPLEIRRFWKEKIKKQSNVIPLYAYLIRNALIPTNQLKEANEEVAKCKTYCLEPLDNFTLKEVGYGEALFNQIFKNYTFTKTYWKHLNAYSMSCVQYLKFYDWDLNAVKVIVEQCSKHSFYPMTLVNDLNRIFSEEPALKTKFEEKLFELNLEWPNRLN